MDTPGRHARRGGQDAGGGVHGPEPRSLAEALCAQLDIARGKLDRLVCGLELVGPGREANAVLEALADIERRTEVGDLAGIKDAAGSRVRMEWIAEAYDRVLPEGGELTEA